MISVILCTYRSEQIIASTLRAILSNSRLPLEIILVDNASPDGTVESAEAVFRKYGDQRIDFRVLVNGTPGVAGSREMGVHAARGEISLFVDDDNVLDPGYLAYVEDFFRAHPSVHMLCNRSYLPPQMIVPAGFDERKLRHYAVGSMIPHTGSIAEQDYIWSAGTAFRTRTMQRFFRKGLKLRCGQSKDIMAGEDTEFFQWYRIKGLDVWFSAENAFEHRIDPTRLEETYFQRLRETQVKAGALIDRHYDGIIRFSRYKRKLSRQFTLYDARQALRGLFRMMQRPDQWLTYYRILAA